MGLLQNELEKSWKPWHAVLGVSLLYFIVAAIRLQFPDLDHGDSFQDAEVLISGRNFAKFSFRETGFLPVRIPNPKKPLVAYTHYPPLSHITNGILCSWFPGWGLKEFRMVALCMSLGTVLAWFGFLLIVTRSAKVSFLGAVFYLSNPSFLLGIDSVNQTAYSDFFRSVLLLLIAWFDYSGRWWVFCGIWMAYFLQSYSSFEYYFFTLLFWFLYPRFLGTQKRFFSHRLTVILLFAPIAAFGLFFWQNVLYHGSLAGGIKELAETAGRRIGESPDSPMPLTLTSWFDFLILYNLQFVTVCSWDALILGLLMSYLMFSLMAKDDREPFFLLFKLCLVLFSCGISFYIFFPGFCLAHVGVQFPARYINLFAVLLLLFFFKLLWRTVQKLLPADSLAKSFVILLMGAVFLGSLLNSSLPISAESRQTGAEFKALINFFRDFGSQAGQEDIIALNNHRNLCYQYYLEHFCEVVFWQNDFSRFKTLPKYFIFFPKMGPNFLELFQFLEKNYDPPLQIPLKNFPLKLFIRRK